MEILSKEEEVDLKKKANRVRQMIIEMLMEAGSGHTAGSLGMTDVFVSLYFRVLNHRPEEPFWEGRDRLVLSNGHICPALYSAMALAGYLPVEELKTLRKLGSRLQGHPHRECLAGLETTSGPLGSGLSQITGMAIADRIDNGEKSEKFFYCLLGDGELDSGNVWEAGMLTAKEGLGNVVAVIDRNNIQIDGFTQKIMPLEPLMSKWESWGWSVTEIDGHDFNEILGAFQESKDRRNKPTMIIAHTIPGKGVKEFEGKYEWHGKVPNEEQGKRALDELKEIERQIESE